MTMPSFKAGCEWERLPGESSRGFRAFCIYRDQGPSRSLDQAWRQYSASPDGAKASASTRRPGNWAEWSRKFDWVSRAQAYDDALEEQRQALQEKRRRELADQRLDFEMKEQIEIQKVVESASLMIHKMADAPVTDVNQTKKETIAGKTTTTKTKITAVKGGQVGALMQARNQTARQAILGVRQEQPTAPHVERIVWQSSPSPKSAGLGPVLLDPTPGPDKTDEPDTDDRLAPAA